MAVRTKWSFLYFCMEPNKSITHFVLVFFLFFLIFLFFFIHSLGYGKIENTPCARGFDTFFGSYSVGGHHYDHTVGPDTHAMGTLFTLNEGHQQTLDLHRSTSTDGGKTRATHTFAIDQKGIYSSQMIGDDVAKQIHRHASTTPEIPLFMYVALYTHSFTTITHFQVQRRKPACACPTTCARCVARQRASEPGLCRFASLAA